jgi:hypothetical protein
MVDFFEFRKQLGEQDAVLDELTSRIIAAAIEVHGELAAGLTEAHYENALCHEFDLRGIRYFRQVPMPVSSAAPAPPRSYSHAPGRIIPSLCPPPSSTASRCPTS